jgi:hypothetical protein
MTKLMRKADAQNTALVKCIADNAISWIYSPLNQDEIDVSMDDMEEEDEKEIPMASAPITSPLNEDEILIEEPASSHSTVDTIDELENKDKENPQDVSSPAHCIGFSMREVIETSGVISDDDVPDCHKGEAGPFFQDSHIPSVQDDYTVKFDDKEDSTPDSLAAVAIRTSEGHGKLLPHECTCSSWPYDDWTCDRWCCDAVPDNHDDLQERLGAIFARAGAKHKRIFNVFRTNPTADTSSQVSDRESELLNNRLV